jgi:hypothetical protein
MKTIFTSFILLFTVVTFAQKVEYNKKTEIISVKGKPYAKMARVNADSQFPMNKDFIFSDLEDNEIMYMKLKNIKRYDSWGRVVDNKTGYELIFIDLDVNSAGFKINTMGAKGAAKLFVKNKLLKNGKLDQKAKKIFLAKYSRTL